MRCAPRQVGMMQVIGLDAGFDKAAHQIRQGLDIVIHALEQHGLADQRDAALVPAAPPPRARPASIRGDDWHGSPPSW